MADIPKLIHLIWLDAPMPDWARACGERWRILNPGWVVLWHHDDSLLAPRYRPYWAQARWPSVKADLLRLSILNRQGGVYVDTDTMPLVPLGDWLPEIGPDELLTAHHPTGPDNWFLAAHSGAAVFRHAEQLILDLRPERIRRRTLASYLLQRLGIRYPELVPVSRWEWFTTGDLDRDRHRMTIDAPAHKYGPRVLHYYAGCKTSIPELTNMERTTT